MSIKDIGPEPQAFDLEQATRDNPHYRAVAWSGRYLLTLMSIPSSGDIGLETPLAIVGGQQQVDGDDRRAECVEAFDEPRHQIARPRPHAVLADALIVDGDDRDLPGRARRSCAAHHQVVHEEIDGHRRSPDDQERDDQVHPLGERGRVVADQRPPPDLREHQPDQHQRPDLRHPRPVAERGPRPAGGERDGRDHQGEHRLPEDAVVLGQLRPDQFVQPHPQPAE